MASDKIFTCQICGKEFPAPANTHAKFCPDCRAEAQKQCKKRYAQSERAKAMKKKYAASYRESGKQAEWERNWRNKNIEKRRECERAWKLKNPESGRRSAFKYYHAHKQEVKERHRKWRYANAEKISEQSKQYREAHKEELAYKQRLRYAAKVNKPGARLAWAKATGKLTYCERMRVTMYPLPCGTRGECKGCKHCPEGAACGNDGHYRWDMESLNGGRSFR